MEIDPAMDLRTWDIETVINFDNKSAEPVGFGIHSAKMHMEALLEIIPLKKFPETMKRYLRPAFALAVLISLGMGLYSQGDKSKYTGGAKYVTTTQTSPDGKYTWFSVSGDPLNSRIYTLQNGLTVYLTVNKNEPRIQTSIVVRTGSNNDPKDCTGLAHYLEHLLFKGTDRYGTLDYAKEKPLLDRIEKLYEQYRGTSDEATRENIYAQIDKTSGEAAKFAIANELAKMLSSIGAKGTNAYTSVERTAFINDIPSNMVAIWLKIESERFRNPVFRLFHTELEAVYEEKNISLDSDYDAAYEKLMEAVFPTHNYGQQTTIGTVDHLKNPSIKKIKDYFAAYYVPNNMAICLSGDFDPDQVVRLIDENFGSFQSKPVKPYEGPIEAPLSGVHRVEVHGPDAEFIDIAFRIPGASSTDIPALEMINYLLSNSTAGLIDLNLVKQQKVLEANSYTTKHKDYGIFMLHGSPKEGQKLEEVEQLLIEQLARIKSGEFDAMLLPAVVNNMEIQQMRQYESNQGRTEDYIDAFISGQPWVDHIQKIDKMRKLSKEDVIQVARTYFEDNYVVLYKRTGEREASQKVVKPKITPVEVNRDSQSEFLKSIATMEAPEIVPRFLNYDKDILKSTLKSGVKMHYVKNEENDLFTLFYLLDFGKNQDKEMALAIEYLPFLGTDQFSADEISKKFYQLGTTFDVSVGDDRIYVYVSGLASNFEASLDLFEHLLKNARADDAALVSLIDRTVKAREDAKLDKGQILWGAMRSYGLYGAKNPFNDILQEKILRGIKSEALVGKIKGMTDYQHRVLYYGPANPAEVATTLNRLHQVPASLRPVPDMNPYPFAETNKPKVYFVNYDIVQAEILWLSRSVMYDPTMYQIILMFNEYFGDNMSSIVFQTIRESKALAYSTFSSFVTPPKYKEPYSVLSYVGTQADKVGEAVAGMFELLNNIPKSEALFENAKASIRNQIDTERITRTAILFRYENALRHGISVDQRMEIYVALPKLTFDDVQAFHKNYVSGKQYNLFVLGSKDRIDLKALSQYGEVVELSLQDLFGY
ncbi:MAG: hypothetical protein RLZZ165_749 [Bacteroidota bacterium]